MDKRQRVLPDFIDDLGVTMNEFIGLCVRAFENLPSDTAVDGEDVSSILTWCLPFYNRMKRAAALPVNSGVLVLCGDAKPLSEIRQGRTVVIDGNPYKITGVDEDNDAVTYSLQPGWES